MVAQIIHAVCRLADDPRYSVLIDANERRDILVKLKEAELLRVQDKGHEADKVELEARFLLHSLIADRDIVRGATLLHEATLGRTLDRSDSGFPSCCRP
jgi:hypothetical protein